MGSREEECETFLMLLQRLFTWQSAPWHQTPDFINVSRRKNEQLANSCSARRTPSHRFLTNWAPSAPPALMDRLCDCVTAVALLLCVATQVRPASAYLHGVPVWGREKDGGRGSSPLTMITRWTRKVAKFITIEISQSHFKTYCTLLQQHKHHAVWFRAVWQQGNLL